MSSHLTIGEIIVSVGLLLDIGGILLLSISGLFERKPVKTWWYLWRHVDREDPRDTDTDPPVDVVSKTAGGFGSRVPPKDSEIYDWQIRLVAKQTTGATMLLVGFVLQLIGTLL